MADTPSTGGINVGDAVLTFLGDTTDLERAWTEMEKNSTASATRTVNEVLRQYDKLGVEGSLKLREAAEQSAAAFSKLRDSGVASITDLIQAEQVMLEKQVQLKTSLGDAIPLSVTQRIQSLGLQYIGITGTVEQFTAAQTRSLAVMEATRGSWERERAAINADVAAYEREIAVLNEASAAKGKNARAGSGGKGGAAEEDGALEGGIGAVFGTAKQLALYAGVAAVAGSLAEGVKQALAFDAAFTELTTVIQEKTPQSAEVIQMLKNQLLALPPELGNITDLTHGVYQALSAGVPAAEAVGVVAKSATFAKAALTDMETSVKLITASMNAYGMTARDVDHITGALMATIQVGVLRGPQLAESLGRVLPVAANLKVSLSDVLGAASALTAGGLSADEAMTALRQVLSAIEKPSSEAKKAMNELHLSFADVRAEIAEKGLGAGLATLGAKIKDNTTLTTELFGNIRALTGILGLTGPQAQKYAQYTNDITEAYKQANLAQLEFNKIISSQDGQLKTLGNTISNDFTKAWITLTPVVDGTARSLYDLFVNTGAIKVVALALALVFYSLGVSLASCATVVNMLFTDLLWLGTGLDQLALKTHAYSGTADEFRAQMKKNHDMLDRSADRTQANIDSIKAMSDAFDHLLRGVDGNTQKSKEFEAAQLKLAQAQDHLTETTKVATDAASAQARAIQDEKDKHELLAAAIKKTTKAMEQYANAHNIPIAEELTKNVTAAQKFADAMRATGQPLATQNAALINLNIQLGKLRGFMDDKHTLGETLMGPHKDIEDGSAALGKALDSVSQIKDPMMDALNTVLEAEKQLGIQGPVSLAKIAVEAQNAAKIIHDAWEHNLVSPEEVIAANEKVEAANAALAASFNNNLRTSIDNTLDAEKRLGVQGTQTLIAHRNVVDAAFKDLKNSSVENSIQMKQAELIALKADRDLKLELGQPIPVALNNSIEKLTNTVNKHKAAVASAKKEDQQWFQFWHQSAPTLSQDLSKLGDMGTEAFIDLSHNFGSAVQSFESGQKSLGAAVLEAVSSTLEALSGQAAAYALYYTGLGLAAAASGDESSAGEFFLAAAEMAAVAVIAGATGMAMGSGSSSGSGGGSAGGAGGSSISTASQGQVNPVNSTNVVRFGSGGLVTGRTLAMIGDSKSNPHADATEAVLPLDDEESMSKLRQGLGSGGFHMHIDGLISPDNLGKVMDQMSGMVDKGKTLKSSHAMRVVKKS